MEPTAESGDAAPPRDDRVDSRRDSTRRRDYAQLAGQAQSDTRRAMGSIAVSFAVVSRSRWPR
ncbi:hypothetical protein C9I57_02065 [Trinickia symbiotica]|uniref:Uncharacterized protein n=2 Tax=Trinickia symbiotica TaxID=863227 RepID=A0A2T3Y1G8_9BURK|nr:hypothetical protein C9I57_02065 [Trinickia symbiotica]